MSQEWMIDVLSDLRKFASVNGLLGLAEQLDDTILLAATEMKRKRQNMDAAARHGTENRGVHRTSATIENI